MKLDRKSSDGKIKEELEGRELGGRFDQKIVNACMKFSDNIKNNPTGTHLLVYMSTHSFRIHM